MALLSAGNASSDLGAPVKRLAASRFALPSRSINNPALARKGGGTSSPLQRPMRTVASSDSTSSLKTLRAWATRRSFIRLQHSDDFGVSTLWSHALGELHPLSDLQSVESYALESGRVEKQILSGRCLDEAKTPVCQAFYSTLGHFRLFSWLRGRRAAHVGRARLELE